MSDIEKIHRGESRAEAEDRRDRAEVTMHVRFHKIERLQAENARLREELKQIAGKAQYGCCNPMYPDAPVCSHNIARNALKETK